MKPDLCRKLGHAVKVCMLYKTAFAPNHSYRCRVAGVCSRAIAQNKVWRIGWLDLNVLPTPEKPSRNLNAFHQGLKGLDYLEGRHYVIEPHFADTDESRFIRITRQSGADNAWRYG
jgi:hypothetical protein